MHKITMVINFHWYMRSMTNLVLYVILWTYLINFKLFKDITRAETCMHLNHWIAERALYLSLPQTWVFHVNYVNAEPGYCTCSSVHVNLPDSSPVCDYMVSQAYRWLPKGQRADYQARCLISIPDYHHLYYLLTQQ